MGIFLGAKVSWNKVCKPKAEGGMGLKRLFEWNQACLACSIWMLFVISDSLWIAWVKSTLLEGKSFWTVKPNAIHSWCWKKLLKIRPLTRPMIKHDIGNGENTYLWHDNLHPHDLCFLLIALGSGMTLAYLRMQKFLKLLKIMTEISLILDQMIYYPFKCRFVE